jgi:pimeloyl-ACP methyl ester carboxylesterase
MKRMEYLYILIIGFILFLLFSKNTLAQNVSSTNCSLNIYPQPTTGTHRYTVSITNNTSTPGYYFINNFFVDGGSGGSPSNISTPNYYNYWFIQNNLSYQVDGWAGIPISNSSISYDVDLTFNQSFDGIDLALRGANSTINDVCNQAHGTYTITYNDLSGNPAPTPPSVILTPAPTNVPNCGLNIYPQPIPGTHNYTVTLTNNTSKPGYFFINNYFFDNLPSGQPSNVTTASDWYIHAPTVLNYMVTGTAGTPIDANGSISYTTDLTFTNSFNGIDLALSTYNNYTGSNINDICNQPKETYTITYNDLYGNPTPSPVQVPVSKVFFIPGLGASWNVDALINCKDSGYSGNWTLAPYAKSIYSQILSALPDRGWDTKPFYYDWRKNITDNAQILNNYINSLGSVTEEKVNIVGHSMGGLIGRNYVESQEGGKASKLLMVGAPNQGSTLAYPAIYGDIWAKDLIERIAATLQIKRCGIPQSLQNLLPTYDYLRDSKTKILKDVSGMKVQNNYLPTTFAAPFWNVKIGTLAGTGKETLSMIDVIKNPKWPDGKPVNQTYTNEGDGTVLLQSAQIPDASSNEILNLSHSEIIGTTEGVNKVLDFLGSPGIADPEFIEPNSALVIVGYPGNFWVTDKNGNTTQSEEGVVAIINPQEGDYRLKMSPTSVTTDFIVSQFLSSGQTLYKEYKFKGFKPISKTIKYSPSQPKDDCMKDDREDKNKKDWD